jgi:hypothetical protein
VLRELDDELASASRRAGKSLVWTATDREVLTLIDGTIDRKVHLTRDYAAAEVNRPGMSGPASCSAPAAAGCRFPPGGP